MVRNHLKRIAAPKTWPIARKSLKFTTRPKPGGQKLDKVLPLSFVFKELLNLARSVKEVKFALKNNEISINGKRIHDHKKAIGFMDVLSIPVLNKHFRVTINSKGKLIVEDAGKNPIRISQVTNKKTSKGKVETLCLHNGVVVKSNGKYSVGDSVVLDLTNKIKSRLELKVGSKILLTGGSHIGMKGTIQKIIDNKLIADLVEVKTDKGTFKTPKKYAFVIGEDKELI